MVTQPRRLPCVSVSRRINQVTGMDIAGWKYAGAEHNARNPILFITDGLLKEKLLRDAAFLASNNGKRLVIFLDEVHERGINVDLTLALLAKLLHEQPSLLPTIKIIISSATLDPSVLQPLRTQVKGLVVNDFSWFGSANTIHPITEHYDAHGSVIQKVLELKSKLTLNQQLLVFLPSSELIKEVRLGLEALHIQVAELSAQQQPSVQQELLLHSVVFLSTNIAETSLTFPSLRFVIDSGLTNLSVFNPAIKSYELKVAPAAHSTLKQRKGRLGRTQPGGTFVRCTIASHEAAKVIFVAFSFVFLLCRLLWAV